MKTILTILIPLLLIQVCWGQNEITLNPFGKDTPVTKMKIGNTVKFKISNVNTFMISGITESASLNIDFEIPEIFKNFDVSPIEELHDTGTDEMFSNFKYEGVAGSTSKFLEEIKNIYGESLEKKKSNFIETFSSFISNYNILHQQIELESKLLDQIKDSVFIKDTAVLKKNINDYYKAVYGTASTEEAKKKTETDMNALMAQYSTLQQLYDELSKTLEKDSVELNGELKSDDKKSDIRIDKAVIHMDRKKYFSEEMAFAKKTFQTISDIKNRNEIIKKAQSGIDWYNKITQASFVAYTDAEQINEDVVTITPKLKFTNGNIAHEFKPLTIKSYGGLKVNFSTGYLLSFAGDDNFSSYKDSTGNIVGAYQSNRNVVAHSLGGLVHVYPSCVNILQLGISAGASLSTAGNVGFYLGGSVFFLEKNRLVLTAGYSFIKLKKLNTANMNKINDGRYQFINMADTEIRYDDVYKGAWFIGFTYNLAK